MSSAKNINNIDELNTLFNSNGFNNNILRTKSNYDININQNFINLLTRQQDNTNKLEYFIVEQKMNWSIPIIPENIIENIDEETLMAYSDIILFLKNEYLKLIEINQENKKNNNDSKNYKHKKNIKLNLLILDKIKIYTEETFNFIINNYQIRNQQRNIQQKLQIVQNHIKDYKNNFNVDRYLVNPSIYNISSSVRLGKRSSEEDLVNNGQNYNVNNNNDNEGISKSEKNGINNLILNGNFNGFLTK